MDTSLEQPTRGAGLEDQIGAMIYAINQMQNSINENRLIADERHKDLEQKILIQQNPSINNLFADKRREENIDTTAYRINLNKNFPSANTRVSHLQDTAVPDFEYDQRRYSIPQNRININTDRPTFNTPHSPAFGLHNANRFIPPPDTYSATISRTILPIDPKATGILLRSLTFPKYYAWKKDLENEQIQHPHEELKHGHFITMDVINSLAAKNDEDNLLGSPLIISGKILSIDNESLHFIICYIVRPVIPEDWTSFMKLCIPNNLITLPFGYQLDPNKWQKVYSMILSYSREFLEIKKLLEINPRHIVSSPLSSKPPQIEGQIQTYNKIFGTVIPLLYGNLDQNQVKSCRDIKEYITLIHQISTVYNNDSIRFEINVRRMDASKLIDKNNEFTRSSTGTSGGNNNNVKPPFSNNKFYSNIRPNNIKNTTLVNPYRKSTNSLNNFYQNRQTNFDNVDINYSDNKRIYDERRRELSNNDVNNYNYSNDNNNIDNNENNSNVYDVDKDEDVSDFDYGETFVDNNNDNFNFTSNNPSVPETMLFVDNYLYLLNGRVTDPSKTKSFPCFSAMKGKCAQGDNCIYSHATDLLRSAYNSQMKELESSPFHKSALHGSSAQKQSNLSPFSSIVKRGITTPSNNPTNRMLWGTDTNSSLHELRSRDSGGTTLNNIGSLGKSLSDVYGPFLKNEDADKVGVVTFANDK